ncbi:MAG: glycosyltransferase [Candidatus Latescibacteria bacterium]|nr:glycosyltransferase [Candidatus Latescibacterota bacterium]
MTAPLNERALVIIPTYNERDNIENIVQAVLPVDERLHVLVVDDNSPDGTGQLADGLAAQCQRVNVLHRSRKEGLGRAYIAGFKWAIEQEFDLVLEMDADFSHRPEYLKDHLREIAQHDLVLGSRYVSGVNVINWPMGRLLLSYYANMYARLVTGMGIRDVTGGFKCFRCQVLETIDLDKVHASGYAFQIEVTMRAWKKGFKIKEIPIIFYDRAAGVSKMSMRIMGEAMWTVWWLRLKSILGLLG